MTDDAQDAAMYAGGYRRGKTARMLERTKKWLMENPGKKAAVMRRFQNGDLDIIEISYNPPEKGAPCQTKTTKSLAE